MCKLWAVLYVHFAENWLYSKNTVLYSNKIVQLIVAEYHQMASGILINAGSGKAWHMLDPKPLQEPMVVYHHLDLQE